MAGVLKLICGFGKAEYFYKEGWTGNSVICPAGKHHRRAEESATGFMRM
jgi:hypothetical protein